jgi:hypothetical protein
LPRIDLRYTNSLTVTKVVLQAHVKELRFTGALCGLLLRGCVVSEM